MVSEKGKVYSGVLNLTTVENKKIYPIAILVWLAEYKANFIHAIFLKMDGVQELFKWCALTGMQLRATGLVCLVCLVCLVWESKYT